MININLIETSISQQFLNDRIREIRLIWRDENDLNSRGQGSARNTMDNTCVVHVARTVSNGGDTHRPCSN